jgi:hypothetical protein
MKKFTLLVVLSFTIQITNAQNTCASATAITTAGSYVVGTIVASQVPSPLCGTSSGATGSIWYAYTPTQNYTVTVTSDLNVNAGGDTQFNVYTGSCAALTCYSGDDDSGVVTQVSAGTGTGTSSYLSIATFNVFTGTTYFIAWDNRWSSAGFTFQLIQNPYVAPPPTPISYVSQTVSTINSSYNICVADMNGDHKDDIVGVSANNLKVHFQGAAGALTVANFPITGTSDMPSWSMAAGDYNKDGYNDVVLGSGSGLTFWRSNNTGTAYTNDNPPQSIFCQRTNFIDINNDGHLDAFSCHDIAPNVYYINNGSGIFTSYQSGTPGALLLGVTPGGGNYASIWSDIDNDGDRDMFMSKCSGPACELHRNNGNGTYTDISALPGININFQPVTSWSSAVADFDNDGDMDIMIGSNGSTGHRLFRNNLELGSLTFTNITAGSGFDTNTNTNRDYIAYDFDNNGFIDVMGGGGKIMFNQGNGTFVATTFANLSLGAVGDLNNDGFLDFQNGANIRYAVPNTNNWLKLALQGVQSNGNGIGARVEIYGAWGKQIRDVRSGEGFAYMSSLNVHFGLGTATAITKVIVRWPSGTVDTIDNPSINQMLLITEGVTLNLKLFVEGYYDGASTMKPVRNIQDGVSPLTDVENITVELRNPTAPYAIAGVATAMLKTNGTATMRFPTTPSGSYFIAVKSRNGVKTWSATPQAIGPVPLTYDFSNAANKAIGDNLLNLSPGVFGIYSGDLNDDSNVDNADFSIWEADANASLFGDFSTDLNGDSNVDNSDYSIWEANYNGGIYEIAP